MANRLELHSILCNILGSDHVYFQSPASKAMTYPAIRYSLSKIESDHANDSIYRKKTAYDLILIDSNPDSSFVDDILNLQYCSFDRQYSADNLNHFSFTLYF